MELHLKKDDSGNKFLIPQLPEEGLDGDSLSVKIWDEGICRVYPIFRQSAACYGSRSEYMRRHGCACCSLTTVLAAFCEEEKDLRPETTVDEVERSVFGEEIWKKNYKKPMARQMPVSLYGISVILKAKGISCTYVGDFADEDASRQILAHLHAGSPVIVETSRMRREGRRIVRFFDKKYAGSYHTMVLLGVDAEGLVIFTDSAFRAWSGGRQRLKRAPIFDLIAYMFPQKNVSDDHVYFSRKRNTGGYILVCESPTSQKNS